MLLSNGLNYRTYHRSLSVLFFFFSLSLSLCLYDCGMVEASPIPAYSAGMPGTSADRLEAVSSGEAICIPASVILPLHLIRFLQDIRHTCRSMYICTYLVV
ncbi:hypothetical protein F5X98DRAFT_346456 [Xylaria grammica]|nr:hypothetical protein F5X98DRAFT_346456 [Xylaria grammica]